MDKLNFSMKTTQSYPQVAVLMATYQDAEFVLEQLDSIVAQSLTNWAIWASDDSNDDKTWNVLKQYQERIGGSKLHLQKGPQKGFVANFLSLVCQANIEADYFAYCDQDDIWEFDKLDRAIQWLAEIPENVPALYCSRTRLVDEQNNEIGLSPLFSKPPSFANALVQNIGGGNTMVFNRAARSLLMQAGADLQLMAHDWWTYIVVTASGGMVHYDPRPSLRYRQHGLNLIGRNDGWLARFTRLKMLWNGHLSASNDRHLAGLERVRGLLTNENLAILDRLSSARGMKLVNRLTALRQTGIHRQTRLGDLGLFAAALLNKI
jgi:glycosyltransferase involved in cell wall biosynthesis